MQKNYTKKIRNRPQRIIYANKWILLNVHMTPPNVFCCPLFGVKSKCLDFHRRIGILNRKQNPYDGIWQ